MMIASALKRTVVALVIGLIAGWFTILRPALAERDAIEPRMHALEQRLAAHRRTLDGLEQQREQLASLATIIEQHPMRLPNQPDESGLIGHITALAAERDIRIVDIAPGGIEERPQYHHRDITVRMEGRWDSLMRLLTIVGATTRAVALTGLELDRVDDGEEPRWRALGLHLRGYWQPAPAGDAAITTGESGWTRVTEVTGTATVTPPLRRDPFHPTDRTARISKPHGIAYLGRITRGEAQWALIRDAGGELRRRRIGDPVSGLGRLTRIRPQAITLEPASKDGTGRFHIIHRRSDAAARGD